MKRAVTSCRMGLFVLHLRSCVIMKIMSLEKHIVIDARIRRASSGRPLDRLVECLQDIDHQNRYTILVSPGDPWKMHSPNFTPLPCPFPQFSFNPLHEIRFAWMLYRLKP